MLDRFSVVTATLLLVSMSECNTTGVFMPMGHVDPVIFAGEVIVASDATAVPLPVIIAE